jgi:hypothetical protein
MYLYVDPFDSDDLETGVRKIVDALNKLLVAWEPPVRHGVFRRDAWWKHTPCQHCLRRMEYENKMWQANKHVWRRNMCLRHWFVHHFGEAVPYEPLGLVSNQPIDIVADISKIRLYIETANYKYDVELDREVANMAVVYRGRTYRFSFRNHMKGRPYNSSYATILIDTYDLLKLFRNFFAYNIVKRDVFSNVVINDVFVISPQPSDARNCPACQL